MRKILKRLLRIVTFSQFKGMNFGAVQILTDLQKIKGKNLQFQLLKKNSHFSFILETILTKTIADAKKRT